MPSPEPGVDLSPRLARVRLLASDVDGVLTDGSLDAGGGGRRWHVADGFGFVLAREAGLELALISGQDHPEIRARAARLGVGTLRLGRRDKGAAMTEILAALGLACGEALFLGDELFDLPAMAAAGLGAAPADARPEVRAGADWSLRAVGGRAAAREAVEAVLRARGDWDARVAPFREGRDA